MASTEGIAEVFPRRSKLKKLKGSPPKQRAQDDSCDDAPDKKLLLPWTLIRWVVKSSLVGTFQNNVIAEGVHYMGSTTSPPAVSCLLCFVAALATNVAGSNGRAAIVENTCSSSWLRMQTMQPKNRCSGKAAILNRPRGRGRLMHLSVVPLAEGHLR